MALTPGTRLGSYEITEAIGAGGMGEVYRACDTSLNRNVAIKVMPDALAGDPDYLERFQREAKALAALNHPNIAQVYGLEKSGGAPAIVMEFVDGPTLADRISRGGPRGLSLDEALPIARQIAEALEAAHARGIVHRDLKPANVKITHDGTVKVLDFGLAEAMERPGERAVDAAEAPTRTSPDPNRKGAILGTLAYMAPEQARGQAVDKRADVWAFGVVLFEMLAGRRPFDGADASQVLARVLVRDPAWERLPPDLPPPLRRLLRRALVKDKAHRLADIIDARLEIADVEAGVSDGVSVDTARRIALAPPTTPWQRLRPWLVGAVAVVATAGLTWFVTGQIDGPAPVRRTVIPLPQGADFTNHSNRLVAASPDGHYVAIGAQDQLLLRRLDEFEATPLPGTVEARTPFFSPDSRQLGFWANDQIKRMSVTGGSPVVVGPSRGEPFGAHWGDDGFIYVGLGPAGIARLPETGGQPEIVVETAGRFAHGPQLLPGGEWLLFTLAPGSRGWDQAEIVAQSLSTEDRVMLVEGGHEARATSTGHLLFVQDKVLFAQPFDADRLEVSGGPVTMLQGVSTSTVDATGSADYDVTADGTLVYVPAVRSPSAAALVWVDRDGENESPLPMDAQDIAPPIGFALSPDQTQIVAELRGEPNQLWLFRIGRAGGQRLTRNGGRYPVWSADGEWVYFATDGDPGNGLDIWRKRTGLRSEEAEAVYAAPGEQTPRSVSADGAYLYFTHSPDALGDGGVGRLSLSGQPQPEMLVEGLGEESAPSPSPDGRFVAYSSTESGGAEIYVLEIATEERWLISGGTSYLPTWATSGEIVFWSGNDAMMSVAVTTAPEFTYTDPVLLHRRPRQFFPYEISNDGQRFIHAIRPRAGGDSGRAAPRVLVVENWFEELTRLVPVR